MGGVKVGNIVVNVDGATAAIDTGTTAMLVPESVADAINGNITGATKVVSVLGLPLPTLLCAILSFFISSFLYLTTRFISCFFLDGPRLVLALFWKYRDDFYLWQLQRCYSLHRSCHARHCSKYQRRILLYVGGHVPYRVDRDD